MTDLILPGATVLLGDCIDRMKGLADRSAQMCVTSPPYFGLRDYGHDGQIGLEETPEQFIAKLVEVFREVWRVLADDGVLWVNIGDSYCSTAPGTRNAPQTKGSPAKPEQWANARPKTPDGMKPKDLIGIPWMLAFALRADGAASPAHMRDMERMIAAIEDSYESRDQWPDRIAAEVERLQREHIDANRGGWYLRQDIIWHKPNPMPESVTDRCTKSHEYIFLLSKSARYFYDHEAVKEPASEWTGRAATFDRSGTAMADHIIPGQTTAQHRPRPSVKRGGFNGKTEGMPGRNAFRAVVPTRNRRSVWTIATRPYKGAHFAVFPPALVEPCILAGSRPGDTVLDPFNGSGTTGAVALKHGRPYVGIELNAEYLPLTRERLEGAIKAREVAALEEAEKAAGPVQLSLIEEAA